MKEDVTFTRERREKADNGKMINILKLLYMLLKQDNQNGEYYGEQLNCKVPTIKKYINVIRASYDAVDNTGFDVEYDRKDKKYRLSSYFKFPAFSPEEIEALHMAIRHLARQEGTPFKYLVEIEKKLKKYFTKDIRDKLKKNIEHSGPETESKLNEMLNIIDEAINRQMKLIMKYHRTFHKEPSISNVVPFSLHTHEYEWYLRAFCLRDKKLKTYSINQIINMKCEELSKKEKALLPEKPDLKPPHRWDWENKELSGEIMRVRVKFYGSMAEKMRKKSLFIREHPSQITENNGEDMVLSFNVRNPYNMIPWILKFGGNAQVLEPEILRDRLRDEVDKLRLYYRSIDNS